jgi:hypothetical protein
MLSKPTLQINKAWRWIARAAKMLDFHRMMRLKIFWSDK